MAPQIEQPVHQALRENVINLTRRAAASLRKYGGKRKIESPKNKIQSLEVQQLKRVARKEGKEIQCQNPDPKKKTLTPCFTAVRDNFKVLSRLCYSI
jgi:hypothetical protein